MKDGSLALKNPAGKDPQVGRLESAPSTHGAWKAGKDILIFILAFVYLVPVIVLFLTSFKTQIQIMEKGFCTDGVHVPRAAGQPVIRRALCCFFRRSETTTTARSSTGWQATRGT